MEEQQGLTYEQAELQLNEGMAIALPEWGGFWFRTKGRTIVFTREGDFFNTPDDQYKKRTDWLAIVGDHSLAIQVVKALRVSLNAIIGDLPAMLQGSREVSIVKTEMQSASMWMGLLLGEIGATNPYPQSNNPASPVIEPHADNLKKPTKTVEAIFELPDQTAKVKQLRAQMSIFIDTLNWTFKSVIATGGGIQPVNDFPMVGAGSQAIVHLISTRLWLGQQLNNIREAQEAAQESQEFAAQLSKNAIVGAMSSGDL
jgi:hypothetical protein